MPVFEQLPIDATSGRACVRFRVARLQLASRRSLGHRRPHRSRRPLPPPDNDDRRFGNYERILPEQPRNYYREYTVDTPGVHHRGARRIVTGGGGDGHVDEWFYTADHYESFCEMEVN